MEYLNDYFVQMALVAVASFVVGILIGRASKNVVLYPAQIVAHIWHTVRSHAIDQLEDGASAKDVQEAHNLLTETRNFCNRVYNIDPKHLIKNEGNPKV